MPNLLFWQRKKKNEQTEAKYEEDQSLPFDLSINRPVYNRTKFSQKYQQANYVGFSFVLFLRQLLIKNCSPGISCAQKNILNRIPAVKWLKTYDIKEMLLADLLAGVTVGIMHIPQGMGYALLANVPPIYGLYTSFFPVLIYWIFGTSRQISIGTFAVVSLMVGSTLTDLESKYVPPADFNRTLYESNLMKNISQQIDPTHFLSDNREKARILIVMANAFWIGVIQIIMFVFQLGFLTSYLSEPMINGFLAGSAIHVFTSQMKFILGISLTGYSGIFKIPKTYINLISRIAEAHLATIIISAVCIIILFVIKIHLNERFAHKMPVPFPTELIIVIFGTLISYLSKFHDNFHVKVIGPIPAGIPVPHIPPLFIVKDMVLQSFLTAIVSFAINFSLCDVFSKAHRYKINTTQELFAYGASNVFSSFFSCFASGGSLARSCVQNNAGGKTQLVSIVSCFIVGMVLAFIAPIFKELPQACLASIIVVALKSLLMKIGELSFYWKVNKIEFFQFLLTFLSVTLLDVDVGLGLGVSFYILVNLIRSTQPYATLLGNIHGTEYYKDIQLYKDAHEIDQIKIVRIQSELHSTNSAKFKKSVYELTKLKPQDLIVVRNKILEKRKKLALKNKPSLFSKYLPKCLMVEKNTSKIADKNVKIFVIQNDSTNGKPQEIKEEPNNTVLDENYMTEYEMNEHQANRENADTESQIGDRIDYNNKMNGLNSNYSEDDENFNENSKIPKPNFKFLIIDCSPINFIDSVGVKTIQQLISDYNEIDVTVFLADCNDAFVDRVKRMHKVSSKGLSNFDDRIIHLSIHDAVVHALNIDKHNKLMNIS